MTLNIQLRLDPFTFQVQPVLQGHDMQPVGDGFKVEPSCNISALPGILFVVTVQLLTCVQLFATSWTAGHQASLSFTISWSLLKPMSIESVMPSNHLSSPSPPAFSLSKHQGLFQ